uniref:Xin actin binding repeat containing 2a n=1 Tax=Labrus bergylta TaxID=56723 RepID=A0A3Q3F1R8_9LABR
ESLLPPSPPLCKETRPFMAELKRLYKHIHPEVRKNIEADFLKSVEWDEILKGEVQSMRWMFENKPLDTIKDETPDENEERNIAQQEIIAGKDVRYTAWMFETQPMDALGTEATDSTEQSEKSTDLARGDVRTATWLFETQPLDYLNKIYQEDEQEMEVVVSKDITGGDVKTARYLFETQHLDSLGKTETIEESHFLNLKSELEEIKGEVKTTTRKFETQPMCVIRGDSGEMLEITTIRKEEMEKGDVKTSRWMFETQPLDMINKDPAKMKLICGISMEDNVQCGVNKGRWLFETKTLDSIKDEEWESSRKQKEEVIGADVRRHCLVFETQPMDTLKDNTNARLLPSEEIVGGDVQTAKHLFETVPMESLKELLEVGKLKKTVGRKKEITKTVNVEALDKGDVTNYKERFECMDLSKCEGTQKIQVEGVTSGSVKSNRVLFESTPMYAMQDSSGHYHEVKTVRREEIVKGDVRSCRWMFETRPIDEFDESINKFQIIKGISKQEIESGDVKTAKWLFETQQLDAIKAFSNDEDEEHKTKEEIEKGDVKTCKWLFETQPMDVLYEKEEKSEANVEEVQKGDVKTCTWLFETQTLDNIHDHTESESETILKTCTVNQEDIHGKDVRLARFLFETENLENLTGEDSSSFRRVTEIDVQSGDVSRMKYIFENQLVVTKEEIPQADVKSTTWLFETTPFHEFNESRTEMKEIIGKSIKETLEELYCRKMVDSQGILIEADEIGDVRMAKFQLMNQEAPEIQKEEIIRGDLSNIMMNLLNRRETTERGITIDEGRGDTSTQQLTIYSLLNKGERASLEKEDVIQGTVSKTNCKDIEDKHRLVQNCKESCGGEKKKTLQESKLQQDLSEVADQRVSSPSPSFISIESRRVDSPLRVTPSPPPYKSVGTPPPPPRKLFTPTSAFSRATPSPTLSRSEKLMKLRDTTSKLSHSMTPPPPMPVTEFFAVEREQSSPFSDRGTPEERHEQGLVDVSEMVDSMMTVRDKKSFFEEAQKAEVNRAYFRKDPIDIPERLGADAEEGPETVTIDLLKEDLPRVDLSKLVNRFESPQPKVYPKKEPIVIAERLESDNEDAEAEPHTPRTEEIPTLNVKAIKDVFETGEHSSQAARELREQIERRESESTSEPLGHSETTAVTEQFCSIDDFGNMTRETRSEVHSGSSLIRGSPPSYADVVRGAVPTLTVPADASTEELLRSFQQSWAESQGVFQNLGFSVTEQRTSQITRHQQETVVTGKPCCAA